MRSAFAAARKKLWRVYENTKFCTTTYDLSPLSKKILVGTHHKTGTVWLRRIFRRASVAFNLKFYEGDQEESPEHFDVFLQEHSKFALATIAGDYRGIHIIRDPRDRIVSGCFYHQKSDEPWLHQRREEFGGLTYQEKINSYGSNDEKLMFEMENAGADGIREMLAWNYEDPKFFEVKYEDLIKDENLELFHSMYTFLGLPGFAIPRLLQISYENSLFSGNVKKSVHVRSGSTSQWERYFGQRHKERFVQLFPNALASLGYEADDGWVGK